MLHVLLKNWQPFLVVTGFFLFWVWESLGPFFVQRGRVRHAARNLAVAGVNALVLALAFSGATVSMAALSESRNLGLLHFFEMPAAIRIGLAFLVLDAWTYWWHRANHRIPFLWRFHRVHHSDPNMDVSTATRFHTGEIVISSALRLCLIPVAGMPIETLILYDAILILTTQFHHSNIELPGEVDRVLRYGVVSPNMHKIHHSRERRETDSNYTSILSLWDRFFGTYREKDDYRSIRFGLEGFDDDALQSLRGLWMTPLLARRSGAYKVR